MQSTVRSQQCSTTCRNISSIIAGHAYINMWETCLNLLAACSALGVLSVNDVGWGMVKAIDA